MLQPRRCRPTKAIESPLASLVASLYALSLCSRPLHSPINQNTTFVRHASHATQGRANGPKDSAGRRLGAKKSASEYVIPGNIIFKQRGTKWFPGENVDMGKDHTIFATVAGYVRYYKDPTLHPKRRYVGVALEREGRLSVLPTPRNAASRRRLGMYAAPIKEDDKSFLEQHLSLNSKGPLDVPKPAAAAPTPMIRRGTVMAREANFEIGRTAEKKGITVREFDRGDRWLAWRKRAQKIKRATVLKAANATRKTKGKKANKGAKGATGPVIRR